MRSTGDALRDLRKKKGLSQEQVARDMGVALLTYGNWERDDNTPTADNLVRLADYYGVHPRDLLPSAEPAPAEAAQ